MRVESVLGLLEALCGAAQARGEARRCGSSGAGYRGGRGDEEEGNGPARRGRWVCACKAVERGYAALLRVRARMWSCSEQSEAVSAFEQAAGSDARSAADRENREARVLISDEL